MIGLRMQLFGPLDARLLPSGTPLNLPTKKGQALLAYLGTQPEESHSRQKLSALLWADKSDEHARNGLRHVLVALRRALSVASPCRDPALQSSFLHRNSPLPIVAVMGHERVTGLSPGLFVNVPTGGRDGSSGRWVEISWAETTARHGVPAIATPVTGPRD